MAVYYKFKSAKNYELLHFEGHFISIKDLKTKIFESKYMSKLGTDIDIAISNALTGQEYVNSTDFVPRNTSLILRRVAGNPRMRKAAKSQLRDNDMITIDQEERSIDGKCIIPAQTSAMQQCDEEASREEEDFGGDVYAVHPPLNPSQGLDTRDSIQKTTNRDGCKMTKNTNKTIDNTLLQPHHSSEFLHPYWMPGIKDDRSITVPTRVSSCLKIPPELNCPICKKIMKDAVLMAKCCFYSYCRECITKHLINSNKWTCLCGEVNISVERDLVLNKTLQQTIQRYAQITNSPQPCDGVHNSISNVTSINSECSSGELGDSQIIKKKRKVCPRPGYVCYRCHVPGHFIHNCPTLLNDRPDFAVKSFKPVSLGWTVKN